MTSAVTRFMPPLALTLVLAAEALGVAGAERDSIPTKFTWNLADLYPNEQAWTDAKKEIKDGLAELVKLRGTLGGSPQALHKGLSAWLDVDRKMSRFSAYASMAYDLDQRVARTQQMNQEAQLLRTDYAAAASWIEPEIIAAGPDKIRSFLDSYPELRPFRQPVEDVLRRAPHTLSSDGEKIVALAGTMAPAGEDIRGIFVNADFPYPEVALASGEKVRLDAAAYTKYRASSNRQDRVRVFEAFWGAYGSYVRTLGTALNAQVRAHVFQKNVRAYGSCLEAALFTDNIPVRVYTNLLEDVHRNLPTLHRYLRLRQRMMVLDALGYEDLYAPIVPAFNRNFTPEEGMKLTLDAVAPLGPEYQGILKNGFENRWIDWMPTTGKRSGAYSNTVYGFHPFQLQNFTGLYEEVSTLAHESGHSMHSFLADRTQPYPTHAYSIFLAEIASTLNENLLFHSMLDAAKDDETRLFLLGSYLDNLRTTLFRQTLFAEFELKIHESVEKSQPLTGESLNALYLSLARQYYGHDTGVCRIADAYGAEWAYIPHFYYNFYVYQYATSVIAAVSLADGIRAESPGSHARRDAYLALLSAGSSRYAFDLLKDAGVDMTTSAPFDAAMREMNRIIDQMESILDRRGKSPK